MSKRQFKAQASSSRMIPTGAKLGFSGGFGSATGGFGAASSPLSYLAEQPDLTAISDPNVVVSFKNLSKRDSTTKAKALEELLNYVSSLSEQQHDLEDAFLDAWIKVYPRATIDVSRRVRQSAHLLHGQVCLCSGKRIAKYMPSIIGAWVAGLYDGDKSVNRAAQDALQKVFPTPEKRASLNMVYQLPILEFASNAALKESPQTLSDEKTTTPEDADSKYSRVISSSIAVLNNLLTSLPEAETRKHEDDYERFVTSKKTWAFMSSDDPAVRRTLLRFLRTCLQRRKDLISNNVSMVTDALLSKQVVRHQTGSALEYSESLAAFSALFPSIWSTAAATKSSAISRLADLAKAGSQGAPSQYWTNITKIWGSIPEELLPSDPEQVSTLLTALHTGITRRDEPRLNAEDAWGCYITAISRLATKLGADEQEDLMRARAFPIIRKYLNPEVENSQWTIQGSRSLSIVGSMLQIPSMMDLADAEWPQMVERLLERIQTSSPEQSKDYEVSQKAVASEAARLFAVEAQILKRRAPEHFSRTIFDTTGRLLDNSIASLKARSGKPYGAAAAIESAVRSFGDIFWEHEKLVQALVPFVLTDLPDLLSSPSCSYLVSILYQCHQHPSFAKAWNDAINTVLDIPEQALKQSILKQLLGSPLIPRSFEEPARNIALQKFLTNQVHAAFASAIDLSFLIDLLRYPTSILAATTADDMLQEITKSLAVEAEASGALSALGVVARQNPKLLRDFLKGADGATMVQHLLLLTESENDELAHTAADINKSIETVTSMETSNGFSNLSIINVIERGLYEASPQSLTVDTLVELGQKFAESSEESNVTLPKQVLPNVEKWSEILRPFLNSPIKLSMALTNQLGGAAYLVNRTGRARVLESSERDKDGQSPPLRIARYTIRLLANTGAFASLNPQMQADVYRLLLLTAQLANDKLGLFTCNELWINADTVMENEMLDFISEAQRSITAWSQVGATENTPEDSTKEVDFLDIARSAMFKASTGLESLAFQNARAYSSSISEFIEMHGWQKHSSAGLEEDMRALRRSKNSLAFAAFVVAYKTPLSPTQPFRRTCNELVAGLTGLNLSEGSFDALQQLVYLNLILRDQDEIIETIAKQRQIFFVKHVITWLNDATADVSIKAETCKALTVLLPHMNDVYGTHWSEILDFIVKSWNQMPLLLQEAATSANVPFTHSTLKLTAMLRTLTFDEDSNDDLKDSWQEYGNGLLSGLMQLLKSFGQVPDDLNQPLQIVNELVGRQISSMPLDKMENAEELYPLLSVASHHVQSTAFELLHKSIPAHQEQVSIDAALEKSTARLPDEILSLIIAAPTLESLADVSFDRKMPLVLRGYLSSWLLVFDHFKNASDKIKNDYIDQLKDGDYLSSLLGFTFDFLGHSRGKPLDASKFDATSYSFDIEESPVRDVQWLLIHLYYICLKRVPALTKAWWMQCKSRQVVVTVEDWTEKYISPHIISDALTTVNKWADSQDASSDEALIVKVNQRTKEVTVSKEIDDQMMTLAIRLPGNFPLGQAVLHGVNRVAVDEKKWRSWLLNSQGVITFSNNSLIDGIIAFRRNVVGALKGQTECAICYSIVGADKQLPTKRCGTCKNLFHGSCLYRWFKSSNSSSCPLCRNPFNYT